MKIDPLTMKKARELAVTATPIKHQFSAEPGHYCGIGLVLEAAGLLMRDSKGTGAGYILSNQHNRYYGSDHLAAIMLGIEDVSSVSALVDEFDAACDKGEASFSEFLDKLENLS